MVYLFQSRDPTIELRKHLVDVGAPRHGGRQVPFFWHIVFIAVLFLLLNPPPARLHRDTGEKTINKND